ncbi:MAG: ATP12 family chaperone protein [Reyranellaceae bacterium]
MRRFYGAVDIASGGDGYAVTLDGKPIRTPSARLFAVPSGALAQAIAGEWAAVPDKGEIRPQDMPMTRLAMTALDRAAEQREKVVADIAAYGGSDLLCYRAEEPPELVRRQATGWDPLLEWARTSHGVTLTVTAGVMPVAQSPAALAALRAIVEPCDDFQLSALYQLVAGFGSLVLALAVLQGRLTGEAASDLAEIDAAWQAERWGEDAEAAARRARLRADMLAAARFLTLLRATD